MRESVRVCSDNYVHRHSALATWRSLLGIVLAEVWCVRRPRYLPEQGHFHLIARANNGIALCKFRRDFFALKERLEHYLHEASVAVYHYVLMKTHIHLLVWIENTQLLARAMQALQVSYWHFYQRRYPYRGHLWHGRYRSILIKSDAHLLQCGGYIEVNPVHAGIVADPALYRWSSYHFYAFGEPDSLVTPNPLYLHLDAQGAMQREQYQEFVRTRINPEYQKMKKLFEKELKK